MNVPIGTIGTTNTAEFVIYIVLRKRDGVASGWRIENSNIPAPNAEAAIRIACKQDAAPDGIYVAVPAHSWRPVRVRGEQTMVIKLEDAK